MVQPLPKCAVQGCDKDASYEVILYDLYLLGSNRADAFFEQDETCPYICDAHLFKNEAQAEPKLERKARGFVEYPYTNRGKAQGFTIYRPLQPRP